MTRFICLLVIGIFSLTSYAGELRLGIIGLDTPHVTDFTELLNNPDAKQHVAGARVVAAVKTFSPDIAYSREKVEGFTATLRDKYGVKICETIEQLCGEVDAVLIESIDGRPHLAQAKAVIASKKPLFIDKPIGGTLADAIEIFRMAEEAGVPLFTSSSLRFAKDTQAVHNGSIGTVLSAETTSPAYLEKTHPDLFWYGVHGCESLFAVMGTGCKSVVRRTTADGQIEVVGTWNGGRVGTYRESKIYEGKARGEKGEAPVGAFDGYAPLVVEIVKFFQTKASPVPIAETIELFAFMEAADESKRQGGKSVLLSDVLEKAKIKK